MDKDETIRRLAAVVAMFLHDHEWAEARRRGTFHAICDCNACDEARDDVARLTAERDAARAALDGLLADVEHLTQANHDTHHPKPGDAAEWQECNRGICPGIRRALSRARSSAGE